jgi:putative transposase
MAEGKDFAHDSLYRALQQPLALYFTLALELCCQKGGLQRGYLILDDVLIPGYSAGHLKLQRFKDLSSGAYTYGFALVVLAWTDGQTRLPLAFLPYFGGEEASRLDLALSLLAWAATEGFKPEGVLFDAWYASGEVLAWLHARGWPLVTRLRSNRLLDGIQLKRQGGAHWVKVGRLRGLTFPVQVVRRWRKFYTTDQVGWEGRRVVEVYRLRQAIEEIFRGLQQELGWVGHRHRKRVRLLAHLALGMVAYGLIELQRERLKLSFYQCRRKLMVGTLALDLSPLEAA